MEKEEDLEFWGSSLLKGRIFCRLLQPQNPDKPVEPIDVESSQAGLEEREVPHLQGS
jgi:hypothetical protein